MPTETRQRARRPLPAETPGEIPGQTSIWDALDSTHDHDDPTDQENR